MTRIWLLIAPLITAGTWAQPLRFEERHVHRTLPGCGDDTNGCAKVTFDYVDAVDGSGDLRMNVNSAVGRLMSFGDIAPEAAADQWLRDYQKSPPQPPMHLNWEITRTVKVLRHDSTVISLACDGYGFDGGVHPYGFVNYATLDASTGRAIPLTRVIREGALPALNFIAEKYFRQVRKLTEGQSLTDAGFTFENGFQLNNNFALTENALVFRFNAYEIGAYAWGPTDFKISLSEIAGLLRPEFVR